MEFLYQFLLSLIQELMVFVFSTGVLVHVCHKQCVDSVGRHRRQEVGVRLKVAILHDTRDRYITTRLKGQTRIIEHYGLAISIYILYSRRFPDITPL